MTDERIDVNEFEKRCLAVCGQVAATGRSFVVTKDGRPLVRVAPATGAASLRGSVTYLLPDDELIAPLAHG